MMLSDLTPAGEVHRRDLHDPAYLVHWLVSWPQSRWELRRLTMGRRDTGCDEAGNCYAGCRREHINNHGAGCHAACAPYLP